MGGGTSFFLLGCQNSGNNKATNSAVQVEEVTQLSKNKSFTVTKLNENVALMGGVNGLAFSSLTGNKDAIQKSKLGFKLPNFGNKTQEVFVQQKSHEAEVEVEEIEETTQSIDDESGEVVDVNETVEEIITESQPNSGTEVYSILKMDDGFLIGGNFTTVNGKEIKSFVKLKDNGEIDTGFVGTVQGGNVYKIIKYKDGYLVAGTFGAYNSVETAGLVHIDEKGNLVNNFSNLTKYMYVEVNDIIVLENKSIVLAGAFINQEDSLLNLSADSYIGDEVLDDYAHGIVILNAEGSVDEKLTSKFSEINDEVYDIALNKEKNKIYIAGGLEVEKNSMKYNKVIRYDLEGNMDKDFHIEKLLGTVYSLYETDEGVLISGDFVTQKENDEVRSIMLVNKKEGLTMEMDLTTDCANLYQINKVDNHLIISGNGTFTVGSKEFTNNISITLK